MQEGQEDVEPGGNEDLGSKNSLTAEKAPYIAEALSCVSFHSASGVESTTIPPPT